jgi:hypothetical protein
MRNEQNRDGLPPPPRWILTLDRRAGAFEQEARQFRWRARIPPLKRILRAAAAAVLLAAAPRRARAAFDVPVESAQSAAMGGASLAGAGGDSSALFLNPAAGAGLSAPEGYFMYDQLFAGLSGVGSIGQGFASFAAPTRYGTVGLGFGDFAASGLLTERMLGVTFARRLFDVVDVGFTGKYLYEKYDAAGVSDPVFGNGSSRSAVSADVGAILPLSDVLRVGLAVRNLNSPNLGLAAEDRVARQIQAGVRYDFPDQSLRLTADYAYIAAAAETLTQQSTPSLGLEKGFENDRLKFRIGLTPNQFSGGVGIQLGPLGFDYTFLLNRTVLANNAGTQMVGIRYRFGDAPSAYRERGP